MRRVRLAVGELVDTLADAFTQRWFVDTILVLNGSVMATYVLERNWAMVVAQLVTLGMWVWISQMVHRRWER